jgi:hypothetical protein
MVNASTNKVENPSDIVASAGGNEVSLFPGSVRSRKRTIGLRCGSVRQSWPSAKVDSLAHAALAHHVWAAYCQALINKTPLQLNKMRFKMQYRSENSVGNFETIDCSLVSRFYCEIPGFVRNSVLEHEPTSPRKDQTSGFKAR